MTAFSITQRESIWCELFDVKQVLPPNHHGKPRRSSALRTLRKVRNQLRSFEFGWYHESLRPMCGGAFFVFTYYLKGVK